MIGHALIMAIIVVIAADHTRELHFLPKLKNRYRAFRLGWQRRWCCSQVSTGAFT